MEKTTWTDAQAGTKLVCFKHEMLKLPSFYIDNVRAIAKTPASEETRVKAVVAVQVTVGGFLSNLGLNRETGLEKENLKGYAKRTKQDEHEVKYEFDFALPDEFGEIGAVLVENEHHKEMYLKNITIDGFPNGTINVTCNSWVHPKSDNPENRVFFTNKELTVLRGDDEGECKTPKRIYDYDVYNDLGDPDSSSESARPVLRGKDYPYPRRCRTGRPKTKKEIFTHIPVIRILPSSDLSAFSTLSTPMEELINKTSSLLVADLDDLVVDETSVLKEYELTLLAKIISSKQPNPKLVQAILQKAWNPLKGMKLQSLQNNIFSITFTHEWDRNRILASRPWSVLNAHVVVRDWPPHLNLEEIDFSKSSFWIRVTGLPPNLMSRQNAERIGAKIGRVMEVDFIADGNVAWLRFLRIQVQIDINNPLHTGFYRIKEPNNEVWTRVQYERLPDFCFSCGRLGHTNRGCPHPPTEPPDNLSSPYGPWLRAESPDSCPRSAFWNPIAVKNRANLLDPTSGTSNLPEKSSSDLPDPTLSDNSSLDQPDPSLPDFLGANLGILPPPKALTLAHSDQSFDKTRHQSSEKKDKASNQSPPFFPQFKALNNTETIPKAGTIPHQPGSPPPTKSAPNPHQLILSPNTQQKRKCKFTLELQTKKPKSFVGIKEYHVIRAKG
ncbi:hypothetical protein RJ640_009935 [Escallonia rubra]|uniref:CCHC-type domain-containing protein n=1 Tax=Escallonia rubra TaxID=112253 RepID=A0AA88RND1_9ASTE|nr:hypothetical protein RJ640_009935 [Escallonia rubra]